MSVASARAKERLSGFERADISVINPMTGAALSAEFNRAQFEDLLDKRDMFSQIDKTVRRALNAARERGYNEDSITSVLLVGGSSQIPAVQRTLQRIFGRDKILLHRPLDAVARGAAAFVAGVDFYDHIQHDYAIRFLNRDKGGYDYRTIVKRGTPYPTVEPLARLTVKAAYAGQTQLGVAVFEMSEQSSRNAGVNTVELVFDPSGAARLMEVMPDEDERRKLFWLNEHSPTFLTAEPPAEAQGEGRFRVEFNIDQNKRLLITATDIKTGRVTHKNFPVVKLT
jgi:molecular chaperone DnaK